MGALVNLLADLLRRHEGIRYLPYQDSRGNWTVGVGHLMTRPLSKRAVDVILEDDIADHLTDLRAALPWFDHLDPPRQLVLADMAFNLGVPGLLKWKRWLKVVEDGDYPRAAAWLRKTLYAKQVKTRAEDLAKLLES